MVFVVVEFHENQVQALGGKVESVAKACPHRIRNRRMAVFHDENQVNEQSGNAVIISSQCG